MKLTREDIRQGIVGFIIAVLFLGGGWKYLDQKRDELLKLEQKIKKEEIEFEIARNQFLKDKEQVKILERKLRKKEKELKEIEKEYPQKIC